MTDASCGFDPSHCPPFQSVQDNSGLPQTAPSVVNMIIFSKLAPSNRPPRGLGTPLLTVPRGIPNRLPEGRGAPWV
jgi:hypothetical protein